MEASVAAACGAREGGGGGGGHELAAAVDCVAADGGGVVLHAFPVHSRRRWWWWWWWVGEVGHLLGAVCVEGCGGGSGGIGVWVHFLLERVNFGVSFFNFLKWVDGLN